MSSDALPLLLQDSPRGLSCFYLEAHNERRKNQSPCAPANGAAKEIELDNTLEAMQNFVGGLIECIALSDTGSEVTLVCNDEGKLLGLPLNRPLWDGADVLAGPGFLAGCDNEGNLTSLPQSTMDFYKEKFRAFIIEI